MHSPTIPGRGLATIVGLAFLVAALSALFGDDLLNWHAWTMKHYEVLAIYFGATGSGLLCRYAKRAKMWIACAAFGLLFVACTCLVVYKSLGRQAAATAVQTMSADDANGLIADKMADLKTTRQRLTDADAQVDFEQKGRPVNGKATVKPGCGKHCEDWKRRATEVQSRIKQLEQEIKALGPRQVVSPEVENFAQLLGIFGWSAAKVKVLALLFVPIIWTMVLEMGSIACFEYAFAGKRPVLTLADSAQTSFAGSVTVETPTLLASDDPDRDPTSGGKRGKRHHLPASVPARRLPANVVPISGKRAGNHPVIAALEAAGRPLTNIELAGAMNVCPGESTKRRREVAHLLDERQDGKYVLIGLKTWRQASA